MSITFRRRASVAIVFLAIAASTLTLDHFPHPWFFVALSAAIMTAIVVILERRGDR